MSVHPQHYDTPSKASTSVAETSLDASCVDPLRSVAVVAASVTVTTVSKGAAYGAMTGFAGGAVGGALGALVGAAFALWPRDETLFGMEGYEATGARNDVRDQLDALGRLTTSAALQRAPEPAMPKYERSPLVVARVVPTPQAQARYVAAALLLNKTQLARVLDVSRPTVYTWLEGVEPSNDNARRLESIYNVLSSENITPKTPLVSRFVRRPMPQRDRALIDVLSEKVLREDEARELIRHARALTEQARARHKGRSDTTDAQASEQRLHNARVAAWHHSGSDG